jgi:tetratricopeptide (TPR) repeat protein
MNRLWKSACIALLLTAGATFAQNEAVVEAPKSAPPSLADKILRGFGLQATPGKQGNKAYKKGDYEGALRKYAQAGAEAPSAAVELNKGHALYRQKRFAEAAGAYQQALKGAGRDTTFARRAHYNLGNAFYQKGATADSSATSQAIGDVREAVAHYKKALQLDPGNRDAKANLERAQTLLQQLLKREEEQKKNQKDQKPPEPSARAKAALARALQLAQERRYPEAVAVLNEILRVDPTAAPYRSHLQRLDDVIKILNGQDPSPPVSGDPRASQKGATP